MKQKIQKRKISNLSVSMLTQCALCCALYGVLLFFNSAAGLLIEDLFPWVFGLPIFVPAILFSPAVSSGCMLSMLLMTFVLSGFTTWIQAGTMVLAVWCMAVMERNRKMAPWAFWVQTLLLFLSYLLSFTVWKSLLGYSDLQTELAFLERFGLSLNLILCLVALIQAILTSALLLIITLMLEMRLPLLKQAPRPCFRLVSVKWSTPIFLILSLLVLINTASVPCPPVFRDLLLIFWLFFYGALAWYGFKEFIFSAQRSVTRISVFFFTLLLFVFPLNLFYVFAGCKTGFYEWKK